MSIVLRIGAVKSDLSHSIDVTSDVDLENTDDCSYHPVATQTYPGCYGLPYQDHNYGAPPPPTPPASPPPSPPLPPPPPQIIIPPAINGHVETEEETTTTVETTSPDATDDSVTRCICEFEHDDGYMICCDKCSVWQHIDCMLLDRTNIPDTYNCERCEPRIIDILRAKQIQARRKEEIAALVDTSATDTDPEEEANRLGSLGQISPQNKKRKQQKKFKLKDSLSLKQRRMKKDKNVKKDKENKNKEANRKLLKTLSPKKPAKIKVPKKTPVSPVDTQNENAQDAWDCISRGSPDKYELARQNEYSTEVHDILSSKHFNGQHSPDKYTCGELIVKLCCVTEVKKGRKGLISIDRIGSNQPVIEYTGKVMLREQFDKESHFFKQLNPFVFFYSNFENLDLCIDSTTYGSDARFVRRSCAPTAEVRHVVECGQLRFIIYSRKEISKGAEITIPFDFRYQDCNYCVECACLRVNCPVAKYFKKVQASKNRPVRKKRRSGSNKLASPNIVNIKNEILLKEKEEPVLQPVMPQEESPVVDVVKDENVPPEINVSPKITVKSEVKSPVKQSVTHETESASEEDTDKSRKMTREERKMEAIMKAFEKLEKRQERKKDTQCKTEQTKPSVHKEKTEEVREKVQTTNDRKRKTKVKEKVPEIKEEPQEVIDMKPEPESPELKVMPTSPAPVPPAVTLPPPNIPEVPTENVEEQSKEKDVEEVKEKIIVPEEKVEKPKTSRKRRRSHAAPRRRTRQNSSSSEAILSHDESSSSHLSSTSNVPIDVAAAGSVSPMKGFKFLKTKKHLMNEWLSEKSQDDICSPSKTDPLEIQVDEEARFVTCLPSPRNTMDHLRRNSQSAGCGGKVAGDNVSGSAKKRWLRQAMFETPEPGSSRAMSPGHSSGNASPVPQHFNGSCSPNPSVSVHTRHISGGSSPNPSVSMPSPGGSPPTDFVTPLKKRRLARESLSLENPNTPTTSTPSLPLTPTVGSDSVQTPVPFRAALEAFKNKNGFRSLSIPSDEPMEEEDPLSRRMTVKKDDLEKEPTRGDVPDSSVNENMDISNECEETKCVNKTSNTSEEGDSGYISSTRPTKTSESDSIEKSMDEADSVDSAGKPQNDIVDESLLTVKKTEKHCSETSINTADSSEMCENHSKIKTDGAVEDQLTQTNEVLNSSSSSSSSSSSRLDFDNKSVEVSVSTTDSDKFSSSVDRVTSDSSSNIVLYSPQSSSSTRTLESDSKETESDTTSASVTTESCSNNFISPSDSAISSSIHKQKSSDVEDSVGSSNTAIYSGSGSSEIVQSTSHDSFSSSVTKFPSDSTDSMSGLHTSEIMADCSESVSRNSELLADCSESRLRNLEIVADSTNTSHDSQHTADTFPSSWNHCDSSISSFRDSALTVPQHYFSDSMNNCDVSSSTNILFKASSEVSSSLDNTSNEAQGTQVPAKKKVSLLEYRKRLKEKKDVKPEPPVASSTTSTSTISASSSTTRSSSSRSKAILSSRTPKLDPLPLFKPNSPEKAKKSTLNGDPFSPPWRSKSMSLSERLRLEFGLDDSEEDDKTAARKLEKEKSLSPPPPPPPSCLPPPKKQVDEQPTSASEPKDVNNQSSFLPPQTSLPGAIPQPPLIRPPAPPPQPGHVPLAPLGQRISTLLSLPHFPDRLRDVRPPNGIATPPPPPPPPHVQGPPPHRPGIPSQSSQQYGRGPPNPASQNQNNSGFPPLSSEQTLSYQPPSSSQHHQPCQVIEYNHQTRSPSVIQPSQYNQPPPPPPPPRYAQTTHSRGRNYGKKRGRHFR